MNKNLVVMLTVLALPFFIYGIIYGNSVGLFTADTTDTNDETYPSVSVDTNLDGTVITFSVSASDNNKVESVSIFIDGEEVKKCSYDNSKEVECKYSTGSLSQGSYTYKIVVSDGVNQVATRDKSITV